MKNTLAENMLRFGVKNLSESDLRKLHEQTEMPATTTTPGAKPKQAERRKFESVWNANQQGKIVPAKVVGYAEKQPDGSFKPLGITMTYPKGSSGNNFIGFGLYNNVYVATGQFKTRESMEELVLGSAGVAKGPMPLTALNDVITQLSKFTKTPLSLDPKVVQGLALPASKSAVGKIVKQPITTGILRPWGEAQMHITYNPETNAETKRELWIGGSNMYTFAKDSKGNVGYNASVSNYDSLFKKLGMTGTSEDRKKVLDAATILYNELDSKG